MTKEPSMKQKIALFWPGDARAKPNELALPNVAGGDRAARARARRSSGASPTACAGFLSKPHEAIEKLGPIDDPMIGVCVHWFYGPHTTDGVVGKDNPLLLASNFSGRWPGLVGLLNTGACLESLNRPFSRIWTDAPDLTTRRRRSWSASTSGARPAASLRRGRDPLPRADLAPSAARSRASVADEIRERRILILMLGDTSMGMINGYFGPRLLNRHGFTEHKVDQAWIIDRGRRIDDEAHRRRARAS